MHESRCELSLDVSNSCNFNLFNEVSDTFFTLLLEQLFKSVWAKIVEELSAILFLCLFASSNVEVDSNVERDSHIILCGDMLNWALVPNGVFCDHCLDFFPTAVAASVSWVHNTRVLTKDSLQSVNTVWNVDLSIPAAGSPFHHYHDWNSLRMSL